MQDFAAHRKSQSVQSSRSRNHGLLGAAETVAIHGERERSAKFHNGRRGTNISPDMMSIKKTTGWNMTACQKDVTPVIATMHYLSQESLP